jgi:hypothetical protein
MEDAEQHAAGCASAAWLLPQCMQHIVNNIQRYDIEKISTFPNKAVNLLRPEG